MGKIMTAIRLTNAGDRELSLRGQLPPEDIRSEIIEALVDTGATTLAIPDDVARRLGLRFAGTRNVRYANGQRDAIPWVEGVRVEILGREMTCDAFVVPAGATALIGQIPLEALDLIVDPKNRELRVNPESPESPLLDLLPLASH